MEEALAHVRAADRREIEAQLADKRNDLGEEAIDEQGDILESFPKIPLAQEYMALRRQLRQLSVAEETEARIFNDLETFFSRYYDQGDFLSQRRYSSREHKYCLPYNGEEVLLHWANRDQYYVKTAERYLYQQLRAPHRRSRAAGDHLPPAAGGRFPYSPTAINTCLASSGSSTGTNIAAG